MSSEVERAVEFRALDAMLALALNPEASTQARAIDRSHISDLLKQWSSAPPLAIPPKPSIVLLSFSASKTSIVIQKSLFRRSLSQLRPACPLATMKFSNTFAVARCCLQSNRSASRGVPHHHAGW